MPMSKASLAVNVIDRAPFTFNGKIDWVRIRYQ
jgi:hypothetical protein